VDIDQFRKLTFGEAKDFISKYGTKSLTKDISGFLCDMLISDCVDLEAKVDLLVSFGVDINARTLGNGFTPLANVVKKTQNSTELIDILLRRGADIDAPSDLRLTPLHCAVIIQNRGFVEFLLSRGSDPNLKDSTKFTPIMHALKSNCSSHVKGLYWRFIGVPNFKTKPVCLDILSNLARAGAKLDYHRPLGDSVLEIAIAIGETPVIDCLLENGVKTSDTVSSNSSKTLLMSACESGKTSLIKHFLQLGADVNAVDHEGKTALFYATNAGTAKLLLDAGANLTHLDKYERSIFHHRHFNEKIFLKFGTAFVHLGGDIHGNDADGRSFMHHLVRHNDFAAGVKLAIKFGCDVNVQDQNGTTPLMLAHSDYWQILIAAGARINEVDANGDHALNLHLSRDLLAFGADVNLANKQGQTPLMLAAKEGNVALLKALIKAGARAGAIDRDGKLATDYADTKALAALVKLGAPVSRENASALSAAITGKNLALSLYLLGHGLKAHLNEWQVKRHSAFLESIAQSHLDLFRNGIFGEGEKAIKLVSKIVAANEKILELGKSRPVCEDEELPEVLRPGVWPRRSDGPTPHIQVVMPQGGTQTPSFNPPPGFEARMRELHDRILANISGWSASDQRYTKTAANKKLRNICKKHKSRKGGLSSWRDIYNNRFEIDDLLMCKDSVLLEFWKECFHILSGLIYSYEFSITDKNKFDLVIYRLGGDAFEGIRQDHEFALHCLSYFEATEIAPVMARRLENFPAQAWFNRFPDTGITGLLSSAFSDVEVDRRESQQALRWLSVQGFREKIETSAKGFGTEAHEVARTFLDRGDDADFLPKKLPKLPAYFVASAHPAPLLKTGGKALPEHAVETLCRMMLVSTCTLQTPALAQVIEACDRQSFADFALSLYDSWFKNGSKKDGIGFLHALGYVDDARAAALLIKSYRNAPFYPATAAAIAVLGAMGTRTSISGLLTIKRFSRYEKAQGYAQDVLENIGDARGLTPQMLEDLAVPDLGLDSNGYMTLDFGPRQFLITLDANLDAVLTGESGNLLKALPKALKNDNAQMAKTATAQWKEFKAALKVQASDQKKRFEQAMLSSRDWDGATFKEVVTNHPLLSKMVRSLVWATVNGGVPDTAFMVDADGRYVTADGGELHLENEARVVVPHPVHLEGTVETWLQIFAENKLTQPFPQLARKWFAEGPETEKLISNKDGTKVPLGALRGLKAKGWEFEEGGAGMVWSVYKSDEGARASIEVEPGWSLSGFDYEDFGGDQTVKLDVSGSDPIAYSELVRDFLSLPVATGEEP
jgi:ankyrin repeat protein